VIRILGRNIGPATAVPGVISAGALSPSVSGVQVTFDGLAAPLLWVSSQEIDLVTPFELAGKTSTTIQIAYNGVKSNVVQVGVNATELQILGIFNEDFSTNSASHPAKAGSVITLYVAGIGQSDPPSQDGQINITGASPAAPLQVAWIINNPNGNTPLPITFAGAAPGLAAGIFQVNFVAPQQSLPTVSLLMGGNYAAVFSVFVQ